MRPVFLTALASALRDPGQFGAPRISRECPICGYRGGFFSAGKPPRYEARCPRCRSRERHRLLHLYFERMGVDPGDGRRVLHFAPEKHVARRFQSAPNYVTADLEPGKAMRALDLSAIDTPDESVDLLIANHVLEHVPDDRRALSEIRRVLAPRGVAILTAPQDFTREATYETGRATTPALRFAYYGDPLHVRLYGRDLPQRIAEAGFSIDSFRASDEDALRFSLSRADVIYAARKDGV